MAGVGAQAPRVAQNGQSFAAVLRGQGLPEFGFLKMHPEHPLPHH